MEIGLVLAGVVDDPRVEVGTWEVVDDVGGNLKLGVLLHLGLNLQLVRTVGVRELANDLQVAHLVLEGDMRRDAVSLGRVLDAGNNLVLLRPGPPLHGIA